MGGPDFVMPCDVAYFYNAAAQHLAAVLPAKIAADEYRDFFCFVINDDREFSRAGVPAFKNLVICDDVYQIIRGDE